MPEHEIAKHTREIIEVAKGPGGWKHKLGDIALEIGIIVFAITLSLFVERWREAQKDHELEHNFLTHLAVDLKGDIRQLTDDSIIYRKMLTNFRYLRRAANGEILKKDSTAIAINYLYNVVEFLPSSSRYEALKASGKLDIIEDKDLQFDVVNLYQSAIPSLLGATGFFSNFKNKLGEYTDEHLVVEKDGSSNMQQLMQTPVYFNFLNKDGYIEDILGKYHAVLMQSRKVINEIEAKEK